MQPFQSSFTAPPFPPFPAASRYVALGSVEEAITRVTNSIKCCEGIALIMGPPGTGKSIICGVLDKQHAETHQVVSLGDVAITSQDAFFRRLLHKLGVDVTAITDGDLQFAVVQRVCSDKTPEGGVLLLIDEAQSMPADVLEAIRETTNIMKDGQPRVSAVICGSPKLDETLAAAAMELFSQRVATRCYLHPLNSQETRLYITEVIRNCGSNPDTTITDEAIGAIHHASNGIPRLINQMMTEAIDCAADAGETLISEHIVDQAWAQLQQLPSPIVEEQNLASDTAPVEFGSLDDSVEFGEMKSDTECCQTQIAAEVVHEETATKVVDTKVAEIEVAEDAISEIVQSEIVAANATSAKPEIYEPEFGELAIAAEPVAEPCDSAPPEDRRESVTVRSELQIDDAANESAEEEDSICLSEQAVAEIRPAKPKPACIFGDFDQEEPVSVNQPNLQDLMPMSETVEMRLQAHVLQLREIATQARYGGVDEKNIAGEIFELADDPVVCAAPIWIDETSDEEQFQVQLNSKDDSDLLIIEDELDVVPKSLQQPSTATGNKMKIDYQEMLSSMRSGS